MTHRRCCCTAPLWLPFGDGLNGPAYAVANYNGGLVVVGNFTEAGGVTVRGVAFWDGSAWSALGGGVGVSGVFVGGNNVSVANAVAVYGGNLYIGGLFTTVNGIAATYIAKWDGSVWSPVGGGVNQRVDCMAAIGGLLYVGGGFTSPGIFYASWNGSSWADASSGRYAFDLPTSFIEHGSVPVSSVGRGDGISGGVQTWGGSNWTGIGRNTNDGGVAALASLNGDLYAGGFMFSIDGVSVTRLAQFDGSVWSAVGTANSWINALHIWNNQLVTGGAYTSPASRVARYNGSTFTNFGDGFNNTVRGFTTYNGYLVAVGDFTASGALTRNRIAYWSVAETP